jgi:cyclophilin family peptidyl-prolyl cis-trans isomerase
MSVTLHTNLGDLKIELFCEQVSRDVAWQLVPHGSLDPAVAAAAAPETALLNPRPACESALHVQAPKACENFLALCASNYYDGVIFHRNIKGFMIQGGECKQQQQQQQQRTQKHQLEHNSEHDSQTTGAQTQDEIEHKAWPAHAKQLQQQQQQQRLWQLTCSHSKTH